MPLAFHSRRPALSFVAAAAIASVTAFASSYANAGDTLPGQPYASYWFPDSILTWDPATDPDAPFNRGSIPLAPRFSNPDYNVNPHAHLDEGGVQALVAFAPTSFNPSQGAPTFDYYALNYWQYIDTLVFWGGSAGEGLILAPNPTVIDSAHKNGVPVLGNVYLPPTAFGGEIDWVHDFVQRDGDAFPVADKMIEAAEYYGFDGWFINQETGGGDATLANDMRDMLEYFHAHSSLKIVWYDAMIKTGAVIWQNKLDAQNQMFFEDDGTLVSDAMFLNFNWTTGGLASSSTLATSLDRSPYDLFAGVDVEANGYNTTVNWNGVFPEDAPHVTSIGFYRPEWTFNSSTSPDDFYARDNHFWVGPNGDPSDTTTSAAWKGVAAYIPANSPITSVPFVTNFGTGQGHFYARAGQSVGFDDWNNLSLQDVLPTWRWIVQTTGTPLDAAIDFDDAYWGGSSLLVSGTLDAQNDLLLYETNLEVAAKTSLVVTYKPDVTGPTHMQIGFAFADSPDTFNYVDTFDATTTEWQTISIGVGIDPEVGRTLSAISLRFLDDGGATPYRMRIGQILFGGGATFPPAPAGAHVVSVGDVAPGTKTVRLAWQPSPDPVAYYNLYQHHANGSVTWLGATPNTAYFIGNLVRDGDEAQSQIDISPLSPYFAYDVNSTSVFVPWGDAIFADGFDQVAP
jgi:mannosyl-glycoprotein endo-beta-N-acetylglucosaminidase